MASSIEGIFPAGSFEPNDTGILAAAKVFADWVKDTAGLQTSDARGVADEEARSRKATESVCGEVKMPAAIEKYETLFKVPRIERLIVTA